MLAPRTLSPISPDPTTSPSLEVTEVLTSVSNILGHFKQQLDLRLSSPSEIGAASRDIAGALMEFKRTLNGGDLTTGFQPVSSYNLSPEQIGVADAGVLAPLLSVFDRYDNYFGVSRMEPGHTATRYAQLLQTYATVLLDIQNCAIDGHEVSSLAEAMSVLPVADQMRLAASGDLNESEVLKVGRSGAVPVEHDAGIEAEALFRWKVGHHLFNAFTMLAAESLHRSRVESSDQDVARSFHSARILLRGTTAAMWYAESFPTSQYESNIRPSMVAASETGSGFSGTDNLEFRYFRVAYRKAFESLAERFGEPTEWSDLTWSAAFSLAETRVIDLEHHTLLAEKVVGQKSSLKQDRILSVSSRHEGLAGQPAVEALRQLGQNAKDARDAL